MAWTTKQGCINDIISKYSTARNYCNASWDEQSDAQLWLNLGNHAFAIQYLIEAVEDNTFGVWNCLVRNTSYSPPYAVPYFFTNYVDGDVDMTAILDAMLEANEEQVKYFVAMNDAYRQSIWNKPFDNEYFASLARLFARWE